MKLDYISNINTHGDNVVRLYDFDRSQAEKFYHLIEKTIVTDQQELALTSVDFIEARNCSLTLRLSEEDTGITAFSKKSFVCELTLAGYRQMLVLLEPFCKRETKGYQWLYDVDSSTDLLFSPAGTW